MTRISLALGSSIFAKFALALQRSPSAKDGVELIERIVKIARIQNGVAPSFLACAGFDASCWMNC